MLNCLESFNKAKTNLLLREHSFSTSTLKKLRLTAYYALVRPHVKCCIQACSTYQKQDTLRYGRLQEQMTGSNYRIYQKSLCHLYYFFLKRHNFCVLDPKSSGRSAWILHPAPSLNPQISSKFGQQHSSADVTSPNWSCCICGLVLYNRNSQEVKVQSLNVG